MPRNPSFSAGAGAVLALVSVALGLSLALGAGRPPEGAQRRAFTLVYSVNNAGYVDVCGCVHKELRQGSLTRRSSFLKQLRTTGRSLLLVDGGSALFPIESRVKEEKLREAVRKAELIVEAYNRMGYQAMAVGAFDLAAGLDVLKKLEKKAKFKMLSANLREGSSGKLYFPPHTIIEVDGVRVGVIGLTLDTLTRPYLEKVAPDAELADPIEAARKSLEEIRGRTDLVVALSHLRETTNFDLVKELDGIEILVDPYIQYGNHHTWIKAEEWASVRDDKLFLRSDGQGARLGIVDIQFVKSHGPLRSGDRLDSLKALVDRDEASPEEKQELARLVGENLHYFARTSLEPHHQNDPHMDHLIEQWKKEIDPAEAKPLETEFPRKDEFATHVECEGCHEKQYAFWLTTAHFNAHETLKKTGDGSAYDCLGCHTLGYGLAFLDPADIEEYGSVQCESCHGTNPAHLKEPEKNPFKRVPRRTCIICHNKEVTQSDFDFLGSKRKVACPKG